MKHTRANNHEFPHKSRKPQSYGNGQRDDSISEKKEGEDEIENTDALYSQ